MTVIRILIQPVNHQNVFNDKSRLSHAQAEATKPHSYQAAVKFGSTCKLSHASEELLKTVTVESLKDFQWYFEQYVINDPFAHSRARTIRRRLRSQGKQLLENYLLPEIRLSVEQPEHFLIEIKDLECGEACKISMLHQFFWEILEDKSLWRDVFQIEPGSVTVVRAYENKTAAAAAAKDHPRLAAPTLSLKTTNVLAITARPSHTKDIPHRLITRSIAAAIDSIRDHSIPRATLEIVRPGTYDALERHLTRFPYGHFEVVHLDLHGDADGRG